MELKAQSLSLRMDWALLKKPWVVPWRLPWWEQEFPRPKGIIPAQGCSVPLAGPSGEESCTWQSLFSLRKGRGELLLMWDCSKGRAAAWPGLGAALQDPPHPTGMLHPHRGGSLFLFSQMLLQDDLPVRASLLTAFICWKISSFMEAKFSRLVEMTSLILSNSLLMKGNSETALFRVEQWWSKVVLQERKHTRCVFYIIYKVYCLIYYINIIILMHLYINI